MDKKFICTTVADERYDIKAVNFSAYGASFVYLDAKGEVMLPLYNYLKPYPKKLQQQFYKTLVVKAPSLNKQRLPYLAILIPACSYTG
ncbi:MAG: hypothetical protein WDO71_00275 [Bacteroidota bacterium]